MQIPFLPGDEKMTQPIPSDPSYPQVARRDRRSLQGSLIRALAAFGLLPLLLLGVVAGAGDYLLRLNEARSTLTAAVTAASADLDLFLVAHRSAVAQLASALARDPGTEPELMARLQETRSAFPGLLTMLITDAEGRIRSAAFDGRSGLDRSAWFGVDVSDRAYFRWARDRREAVITGVFQGRGFGDDALCAVSAPILASDGSFLGVVQGSIRLRDLGDAFSAASDSAGLGLIILDPEARVAWASAALGLAPLSSLPPGLSRDIPLSLPSFQSHPLSSLPSGDVLLLERLTAQGWRVLALMPRQALLQRTLLDLLVMLMALLAMSVLALVAGRRFAERFLRPIEEIAARMDRLALSSHPERFQHRSELAELARLESAFLQLGQRLAASYQQLQSTFAQETALQAALARAHAEALRAEAELETAREIQMAMLPSDHRLKGWPGLRVAAVLEPMRAVGGDFFNLLPVEDGGVAFFIGDVSDKGVPAALFMARTMTLLEAGVAKGETPEETLAQVGRILARDNPGGMFVTVLMGCVDPVSGELCLASAGHEPPLLRTADGTVRTLALETGPALGFEEDAAYPQVALVLAPGEALLTFTDGLSEAADAAGRQFGEARIAQVWAAVRQPDPQSCIDALSAEVRRHRQDSPADDLTLLCLQRPCAAVRLSLPHGVGATGLEGLLDRLECELAQAGLVVADHCSVRLIAEEVLGNALSHGAADADARGVAVAVEFTIEPGRIDLCLQDDGAAFDLLAQNLPDVDAPMEERAIGGLGVLLVREFLREPVYTRSDGLNLLRGWVPRTGLAADTRDSPAPPFPPGPPHEP